MATLLVVALGGCFDGTVRTPPGEGGTNLVRREAGDRAVESASGSIDLAAVGDTALGVTPTLPPDPASYFDPVEEELQGDVVFGNLEGTLTDVSESPKCGPESSECFAFRAPPEYADYLADAGFSVMSDANNHSFDFGEAGEKETIQALHRAGIQQTGLPEQITIVKAGGKRLAFIGFAPYANTPSLTDLDAAQALIRRAEGKADIVVVAIHAGAEGSDAQHVSGTEEEYLGEDRGNPEEFAHRAIAAGADLILGSGPHVLRGIELYRNRLIAYSLGNFSGFHNFTLEGALGESAVLHVTLSADGSFQGGRLASLRLVEAGQPVPDPEGAAAATVAALSAEDFGANAIRVGRHGRLLPP
ncbi:MAG TPA: CapA family protein [Solirubrobacterales bacterium]|jgi:poly-gamma-glutamate capsule biosynthesis protein CapA/YwtB (metallophosphatase superfamily)|nr:CapA family protein [Solirubrobacterales bacterium]